MIDIPRIPSDHLIFESISLDVKHARIVYILHPSMRNFNIGVSQNRLYKLGRGQDCDMRFDDISVSRNHAEIHYSRGHFRLRDSLSKFGSLVLAREPIEITPGME